MHIFQPPKMLSVQFLTQVSRLYWSFGVHIILGKTVPISEHHNLGQKDIIETNLKY